MHAATARLVVVAQLLLLVGAAPAGAFLPPPYGGKITLPLTSRPLTLDPLRAVRASELQLIEALYDTLYRVDPTGVVQPHIAAEMPRLTTQGSCCAIELRSAVVLHDGRALARSEVVSQLERLLASPHRYLLPQAEAPTLRGSDTLEINAEQQTPSELARALSAPAASIVVKRGNELVGSGPFRLKRWGAQELILQAHRKYFAGRPYLDHITLRMFERASTEVATYQVGASHLSYHGASVFGGSPRHPAATLLAKPWRTVVLRVGRGLRLTDSDRFRQVLSLAIDRARLARLIGHASTIAWAIVPPEQSAGGRHDRSRALALLARLRREHSALVGARLTLLVDKSRPDDRLLAGQLVADLDRIGLTVQVKVVTAREFADQLRKGSADLALDHVVAPVPRSSAAAARIEALAGDIDRARACLTGSCSSGSLKLATKRLGLVPLVRLQLRVHYDARIGGVYLTPSGTIDFGALYWRRRH